jgi:hypothetical protein
MISVSLKIGKWISAKMKIKIKYIFVQSNIDAPPHSLKDSNVSLKMKTMKEKKSWGTLLTHNISG